ncbi:MAG: ribonuclease Z [Gemmatimonadetes bacterium]|nr:ribonuclease Z [Gemmatimonadota bacterium]
MRLTILGSGTLVPDAHRGSPAHHVEAGDVRVLLDCGSGTLHALARRGIAWQRLTHIALTHFHADHIGDLVPLLFAFKHGLAGARSEPLTLVGPNGTARLLRHLRDAYGEFVTEPGVELVVRELARPGSEAALERENAIRLHVHPTVHTAESIAYRCERGGHAIGYTGDTGYSDELAGFMDGVDVLVCECSVPDSEAMDTHMSPGAIARFAQIARPRLIAVTHVYPLLDPAEVPQLVRRAGYYGAVVAAVDGLTIQVG